MPHPQQPGAVPLGPGRTVFARRPDIRRLPSFADALGAAFRRRLQAQGRAGTRDLARVLLAGDCASTRCLLDRELSGSQDLPALANRLDQITVALGDLWALDECSEGEILVTLALMQMVLHVQSRRCPSCPADGELGPALIAVLPGERHLLRAALHGELLAHAGCLVRLAFPHSLTGLGDLLARERFALLCLSLSGVFRQEHKLPQLAAAVAVARQSSRNRDLRVIVGGRLCDDRDLTSGSVGADAACGASADISHAARLCCA